MKKTIIALSTLAGVAFADTTSTTYTPFTSTGWTLERLRNGNDGNNPVIANNSITASANWTRPVANYSFDTPIALTDVVESITFSFSMSGVSENSVATLAFEGTDAAGDRALVMGETYKGTNGGDNHNYAFGTTNANDGKAYLLGADEGWGGQSYNIPARNLTTLGSLDATTTFEGSIAWSESDNGFKFTLTQGGTNAASYLLGSNYTLSGLTVALDGYANATPTISNLTITANLIPEPTTATLSLLALAGLAVRRRRR